MEFSEHTSKEERKQIIKYYKKIEKPKLKTRIKKKKLFPTQRRKKMSYKKYLKTRYWQDVKLMVLKRDNFKCVLCDEREPLHVHHKIYKNRGNEKKHLSDLITLCDLCHKKAHGLK